MSKTEIAHNLEEDYNLNDPRDSMRIMRTAEDFMTLLKAGALSRSADEDLVRRFCGWVDGEAVWALAETVVPEFRTELEDTSSDGAPPADAFSVKDVLKELPKIPRRGDEGMLTSEEQMLKQRHLKYLEYLVLSGRHADPTASEEALEDIRARYDHAEMALLPERLANRVSTRRAVQPREDRGRHRAPPPVDRSEGSSGEGAAAPPRSGSEVGE